MLDNIVQRLSGLENQYAGFQTQMVQLRTDINKVTARVDGGERQRQVFENTVINLENQNRDLQQQNYELNEEFLKMQTRTMKDNLIIAGIPESVDENTETVIKTFINDVLKVPGDIPLHVAHRLRKRRDRRPRSIVAKFEHRKDRDRVLEVVKTGVLNETDRCTLLVVSLSLLQSLNPNIDIIFLLFVLQYILIIGNVEVNPGPELINHSSVSDNSISICNINIRSARNKLSLTLE